MSTMRRLQLMLRWLLISSSFTITSIIKTITIPFKITLKTPSNSLWELVATTWTTTSSTPKTNPPNNYLSIKVNKPYSSDKNYSSLNSMASNSTTTKSLIKSTSNHKTKNHNNPSHPPATSSKESNYKSKSTSNNKMTSSPYT